MIPIKYPLKSFTYNTPKRLPVEYEKLMVEELNVWEVKWNPNLKACELDLTTSPEQDTEYARRSAHREEMQKRKNESI